MQSGDRHQENSTGADDLADLDEFWSVGTSESSTAAPRLRRLRSRKSGTPPSPKSGSAVRPFKDVTVSLKNGARPSRARFALDLASLPYGRISPAATPIRISLDIVRDDGRRMPSLVCGEKPRPFDSYADRQARQGGGFSVEAFSQGRSPGHGWFYHSPPKILKSALSSTRIQLQAWRVRAHPSGREVQEGPGPFRAGSPANPTMAGFCITRACACLSRPR